MDYHFLKLLKPGQFVIFKQIRVCDINFMCVFIRASKLIKKPFYIWCKNIC